MLPMLNLPRKKDLDFTLYGFEYVEFLNQGSFGKAYLVQSLEDNSIWVFKVVDMHYLSPEERQRSYDEALLLTQMRHDNIVFCKSTYQQAQENQLVLVMEYCEHGDLQHFVSERSKREAHLDEATLVHFAVQILQGLVYIHEDLNVIHRDIKPANIFMTDENHLKIGDFGICRPTSKDTELVKTAVGSPAYMPPEMVSRGGYTKNADVWALGCVLYELATLDNAFEPQWAWSGDEFRDYLTNHRPPPLTPRYSGMLNALVFMMLRPDGQSRPSSSALLKLFSDFQKQYYSKAAMKNSLLHSDMYLLEGAHPTLVHVAVPILMRFACEIHLVLKAERRHISDWESFCSLMMDNHPRGSPFADYEDAEVTSEWITNVVKTLKLTLETQTEPARLLGLACQISTEGSDGASITLKAFHTFIVENLLRSGCGLLEEFLATQIWIQDMVRVSAPKSLDRYESITEAFDYYCRDGGPSIHEGEFLGIFQDFHPGLSKQALSLVWAFAAKEFSGRILTDGSFFNMILVKPPKVSDIAWRKDREQEAIRGGPISRRKRSDATERAASCLNATPSKKANMLEKTATSTTTPFQNGTKHAHQSESSIKLSQRSAQDSMKFSQRSAQDSMSKVSYCSRQLQDNSTRAFDIRRRPNCHEPHDSMETSGSPISSDNLSHNVISISPVARDSTLDLLEQGTASTSYRQPVAAGRSTRSVSFAGHDSRVLLCCQTLHSMYKLCTRLQGERDLIAQVMRGMFSECDIYASHVEEAVVEIQDVNRFRRHKVDAEFKQLICLLREVEAVGMCWDLETALTSLRARIVEHRHVTDAGLNELYHVDSWAENFVRFTERYSISIAELFRRLFRCVRQCDRILPELDPDQIFALCVLGEHVTQ
ncbi:MAG: hypothetical protein KVP17_004919 [Porospora cf. gigantea B]|uniref:uncharacterized protein n=1 Tax=Porospora cf. gigantea B TaxID=2853592 RepID=UPI003571E708|nr:MAG: hypothetical protein KVP17_004919 [Porospora cf. gigantea B]